MISEIIKPLRKVGHCLPEACIKYGLESHHEPGSKIEISNTCLLTCQGLSSREISIYNLCQFFQFSQVLVK